MSSWVRKTVRSNSIIRKNSMFMLNVYVIDVDSLHQPKLKKGPAKGIRILEKLKRYNDQN
jgi:hypothetical protein